MRSDDFDLRTGVVDVHWALEATQDPIDAERDFLREDLIQVSFDRGTVLDVGWLPSFSCQGSFVVQVVRDQDWEAPIHKTTCKTLTELRQVFAEFLELARATDGSS